ncbi:MAG: electron transport complex subunit RsxC [Candidatus Hadarchaeota archaeon]
MLRIQGFRGGIHPSYSKLASSRVIEKAKPPKVAVLPLRQYVGVPCTGLVNLGDHVKVGQKIADCEAPLSVPIHSSISGTIVELALKPTPTGEELQSIVVESDEKEEWVEISGLDVEKASREEILAKIRESGIAGMGGAAFPTHVKLNPPKDKNVETLIINGVECEPFITGDHRLMLEAGDKIISGAKIAAKVLDVRKIVIAVEDNKPDAAENMRKLAGEGIEVRILKTKYPQGDERHLIKAILGREVPEGGLPFDVGAILLNVGTAKAIHEAVYEGKPLVERVVTVAGDVKEPKNMLTRIGTPFSQLVEECGGPVGEIRKMVCGGPMMGIAQPADAPVVKGTTCVLVFNEANAGEERELPCIRCARCVEACPMSLMPTILAHLSERGNVEGVLDYKIMSCDECGCCSYVCPSKIPLVQKIRLGKVLVRSKAKNVKK